jgi:radical SAM superfamily enzyme YgiQ (UPF0313 family)
VAGMLPHLLSIASYVKQHGFDVSMFDMQLARNSSASDGPIYFKALANLTEIAERILTRFKYDVLGVSCWTSLHYVPAILLGMISKAINPDSLTVVGGYHASTMPSDFTKPFSEIKIKIQDSEENEIRIPDKLVSHVEEVQQKSRNAFDYIVKGEGEKAFLQICRENEEAPRKTRQMPIVWTGEPLDSLDMVEWDYSLLTDACDTAPNDLGKEIYSRTFPLHLSRSCPYDCEFCIEKSKGTHHWRAVSPKRAIGMIREVVERFNPKRIQFMDVCFGANGEWRRKFTDLLAREDNDNTMYWCETAVNCTSVEDLKGFSKMSFEVDFGVESASAEMLLLMRKTRDPAWFIDHHRKIIENCVKLCVPSTSFFVFGFPGETKETLIETLNYQKGMLRIAEKYPYIDPSGQDFCLAPGSDVYDKMSYYSENFGTVFRCPDWWTYLSRDLDALATAVDPSKDLTLEEKRETYDRELGSSLVYIRAQELRDYMYLSAKSTMDSNIASSLHVVNRPTSQKAR